MNDAEIANLARDYVAACAASRTAHETPAKRAWHELHGLSRAADAARRRLFDAVRAEASQPAIPAA